MANDSGHRWFWRSITGATIAYAWTSVVLPYIAPLGATLIAMLLALAAEPKIPWVYIWVAMLVAFAMTSVGILRLDEMLERRRVKDKLNFAKMRYGRNIHGPGVFLGIILGSSASVPIEFEVEEVRTKVNNTVPDKELDITPITVPAHGTGFVDDHVIDIGAPPRNRVRLKVSQSSKSNMGVWGSRSTT